MKIEIFGIFIDIQFKRITQHKLVSFPMLDLQYKF